MNKQTIEKWKTATAVALVLGNIFLMAPNSSAASTRFDPAQPVIDSRVVAPRYVAIRQFITSLSISTAGQARCLGTASLHGGYTCSARLELQQQRGTNWVTIKTWTASGQSINILENYGVTSGYNYRVKTTLQVFNSSNQVVESPSKESSVVAY